MGRAPCCEKVGLKRGRWTREEDAILARYIREHGEGAWRSLPKNAGLLRCGKSCRLRWINYLRADLKRGNISEEEEEMIIKLHATLGNRWSLIAGHLPGRTDNEIKNHWNSHLSRRAREGGDQDGVVVDIDLSKLPGGGKRRGGRPSATKAKSKAKGKRRTGKAKSKAAEMARDPKEDDSREMGEEQARASSSGVTSDGLEEGALGLCQEMVSGLKDQSSPNPELAQINAVDSEPPMAVDHEELGRKVMELDHHECCKEELGDKAIELGCPVRCDEDDGGLPEAAGQAVLGEKDMEWDLAGLDDSLAGDDLWSSLVWDYDDMVAPTGGQEEESVLSDMFFFDNI